MPSAEYQNLIESIGQFKSDLMDFDPSPTIPYSNSNLLKCQAFVVFSHAEMQVYWEAVARRILLETERRWKSEGIAGRAIAALVAFRKSEQTSVPKDPYNPHDGGNFKVIVQGAIKSHSVVIDDNNGIKRSNIAQLLTPFGVMPEHFVETMLIQLDQTGKKRGDMVHKSSRVSIRTIRDPFADEVGDIEGLVNEIGNFDLKLESIGLLSIPLSVPMAVAENIAPSISDVILTATDVQSGNI